MVSFYLAHSLHFIEEFVLTSELNLEFTDKQKKLQKLNNQKKALQDQLEQLELGEATDENTMARIVKLKKAIVSHDKAIDSYGGNVWDEQGNWANQTNLSDQRKEQKINDSRFGDYGYRRCR